MKKSLVFALSVSASLGIAGALSADDSAMASSPTAAGAPAAAASTSATAAPSAAVAPNDAPGSLKAGNELLSQGKYADAVAYFNGIGEQVADHGKAKREPYRQLDLATAYLGLGQYQQAEQAASQAVALKKDLEPAWNDLASAQVNEGMRDKAMDTYKKGIAELTTAKLDHARLDANLKALQAAAGETSDASASASGTTTTAAPTAEAVPTGSTPSAAATVGN